MDQSEAGRYDTVLISWLAMQTAQTAIVLPRPRHKNDPNPHFLLFSFVQNFPVCGYGFMRKYGYTKQFYVLHKNINFKLFWYRHTASLHSIDLAFLLTIFPSLLCFDHDSDIIDILYPEWPPEHDGQCMTLSIKCHRPPLTSLNICQHMRIRYFECCLDSHWCRSIFLNGCWIYYNLKQIMKLNLMLGDNI